MTVFSDSEEFPKLVPVYERCSKSFCSKDASQRVRYPDGAEGKPYCQTHAQGALWAAYSEYISDAVTKAVSKV